MSIRRLIYRLVHRLGNPASGETNHVTIQEKVNVAENSVLFGARSLTIGITQSIFKTENLSDFEMALAGSGAAFFSSIAVCPTELIKTRMQAATELRDTGTFVNKEKVTIRSTFRQVLNEVSTININYLVDYGFIITIYLIIIRVIRRHFVE